jgi:3-phosphoshikimate 1-carboxyvinyltransferase
MPSTKQITPRGVLNSVAVPPGSKSITNRALILAAMSEGTTALTGALDSEDTQIMFDALSQLGLPASQDKTENRMEIAGQSGTFPNMESEIYVGNSGTSARFLTAMLAFSGGDYRIYGKPRMHQRPIRDLVDALNALGSDVRYEENDGFPPLRVGRLPQAARINTKSATVSGSVSSQFLSALLLAAPLATASDLIKIDVTGNLVSKPYIKMTLQMMQSFGVQTEIISDFKSFQFQAGSKYRTPGTYQIEPDASAASYFFAAAAVCGGSVAVPGLSKQSLQGDVAFADCLEKMNCNVTYHTDSITVSRPIEKPLRGITVDMNSMSDTAQTLAVVALFAEGATEITNIEHVRFKETDRIADLATELRRFGAVVEERRDGLRIIPPKELTPATVETYDDHRMAMSFSVAGLRLPGVVIQDPECTRKTFPHFFEVLEQLA